MKNQPINLNKKSIKTKNGKQPHVYYDEYFTPVFVLPYSKNK